jgi:putative serine protease PepD
MRIKKFTLLTLAIMMMSVVAFAQKPLSASMKGLTPYKQILQAKRQGLVNEQNAQANHLSTDHGAYVAELAQGGPAEAAGIQVGDIITRIADQDVTSADSLLLAVRSQSVGDTVDVTLVRNGQEQTVKVKLGSDEALQAAQEEQQRQQAEEQQRQEELQRQQLEQYLQQFQNQRGQSQSFIW